MAVNYNLGFCVVSCEADYDKPSTPNKGAGNILETSFAPKIHCVPRSRQSYVSTEFLPLVSGGVRVRVKESQWKTSFVLTRETGARLYAHSLLYCTPLAKSPYFPKLLQSSQFSDVSAGLYEEKSMTIVSQYPLHNFLTACLDMVASHVRSAGGAPVRDLSQDSPNPTQATEGDRTAVELVAAKITSKLLLPLTCQYANWIIYKCSAQLAAFYLPAIRHQLPLFDLSIKQSLFDEVGLDNSISILACCMTEKFVLLKSTNSAKLVPAAESVLALLYPFQWQLAYVPNLPGTHAAFLEMPQPYVIGIDVPKTGSAETVSIDDGLNRALFCIVDLDSGVINWPEDQTPLPDRRKLINRIQNRLLVYYTQNKQKLDTFALDPVKVFASQILTRMEAVRRFKAFPDCVLAAALLNPHQASRDLLSESEKVRAKAFILKFEGESLASASPTEQTMGDDFDRAFAEAENSSKQMAQNSTLTSQLSCFMLQVDSPDPAFEFFRSQKSKYPQLSQIARYILGVLPSPANAERGFSKAVFLSENRRNRLKMCEIKKRLILYNFIN